MENTKLTPEQRAQRKSEKALRKAIENVREKYPHADPNSIVRATDHPNEAVREMYGNKFVTQCVCTNDECGNKFIAATSDLFQLKHCEECRSKARKALKKAKKENS